MKLGYESQTFYCIFLESSKFSLIGALHWFLENAADGALWFLVNTLKEHANTVYWAELSHCIQKLWITQYNNIGAKLM